MNAEAVQTVNIACTDWGENWLLNKWEKNPEYLSKYFKFVEGISFTVHTFCHNQWP